VKELNRIEVQCGNCDSAFVFGPKAKQGGGPGATMCPNCHQQVEGLGLLIKCYRDLFAKVEEQYGDRVHFLVRLEEEDD
jgi:hypothetical protein